MQPIVGLIALAAIILVLWDVFETVILPRRVTRRIRLTGIIYRSTWKPVRVLARRLTNSANRDSLLAYYGPLGFLLLLAAWVLILIVGYAGLLWACGSPVVVSNEATTFGTDLYLSATTFFTLGLGDVVPRTSVARIIVVIEVANGFSLIAMVIGYMPALYQAFSRREVNISLLDARAGSPPSAGELFRRYAGSKREEEVERFLLEWERWSAELMESHISYPALAYFRSQHDNQSWVAAITAILDVCALMLAVDDGKVTRQARLTFAIARHAVVDLSQVFRTVPRLPARDRLSAADWPRFVAALRDAGAGHASIDRAEEPLRRLRALYEPYANALAEYLLQPLPPWYSLPAALDDWQTSATAHSLTSLDSQAVNELNL